MTASYLLSFSTDHERWFEHTAQLLSNALKRFVFRLAVFAATVSMPLVHTRHLKLYESEIQHLLFIRWNK